MFRPCGRDATAPNAGQNYVLHVSTIEYLRVTQIEETGPCDELFREYISWWQEQMWSVHGKSYDDALIEPGRLYLVRVEGTPVGVVGLKPVSGSEAEIKRMYLRAECRGVGIAEGLLKFVLSDARREGFATVRLDSFDFMTGAHRLYRKVGFRDSEPFADFEGSDDPDLIAMRLFMRLELASH